jgi:hypothetical protein
MSLALTFQYKNLIGPRVTKGWTTLVYIIKSLYTLDPILHLIHSYQLSLMIRRIEFKNLGVTKTTEM